MPNSVVPAERTANLPEEFVQVVSIVPISSGPSPEQFGTATSLTGDRQRPCRAPKRNG